MSWCSPLDFVVVIGFASYLIVILISGSLTYLSSYRLWITWICIICFSGMEFGYCMLLAFILNRVSYHVIRMLVHKVHSEMKYLYGGNCRKEFFLVITFIQIL